MASSSPSLAREQSVLETFFQNLSTFSYDAAKEQMDKEKEIMRLQQNVAASNVGVTGIGWATLVSCLSQLVTAEKSFTSLSFLSQNIGQKIFGRKDSMRSALSSIQQELHRLEEQGYLRHDLQNESHMKLVAHLAGQLAKFVEARLQMADFFEQLSSLNHGRLINCDILVEKINDINVMYARSFHHPVIAPLNALFSLECDVLNHLLQCQREMLLCHFLPCLLQLQITHSRLANWEASYQSRGKKSGYVISSKSSAWPALHQWLGKFEAVLIAKCGLYFNTVFSKQTTATDFKNLLAKSNHDFYGRIVAFQRKSDAINVSVIFDATGAALFQGIGYHHPCRIAEAPRGMDCYPAIASIPSDIPDRCWPGMISLITQHHNELNSFEKIIPFFDKGLNSTYFLTGVEPRLTLIVLFDGHKSERDSNTLNFISDLCSHLRLIKLFTALKPGTK